jgi:hypothetical protein
MPFALNPSAPPGEVNSYPLRRRTARLAAVSARDCKPLPEITIRRGGLPGTSSSLRPRGDAQACKYQRKYKRERRRWPAATAPSRDEALEISLEIPKCTRAGAGRKAPAIRPEQARRGAGEAAEAAGPGSPASGSHRPGSGMVERGRGRPGRNRGPAARIVNCAAPKPDGTCVEPDRRRPSAPLRDR